MTEETTALASLSDDDVLRALTDLVERTRRVEADLVACIAEVDARRLYAREAVPSMFAYCKEILHLSEHEAFLRIAAARASRQHPVLLSMLRDGRLHLSGLARLAPHLTTANREAVLPRAVHRTKRQIEELIAELAPRPEAATVVRAVTQPRSHGRPTPLVRPVSDRSGELVPERVLGVGPESTSGVAPPPSAQLVPERVAGPVAHRATVEAVATARFRVHVTIGAELHDKLERLRALMRSSVPDGDLARLIDVAVTEKLDRLEARRYGQTARPRKSPAEPDRAASSRYIPAAIRRAVTARDGGRCTYRDRHGRRCTERHDLEFHHRTPYARGGRHTTDVLTLLCPAHNLLMAERDFGSETMARYRTSRVVHSDGTEARSGGTRSARATFPSG